jgi:hypothetical protein
MEIRQPQIFVAGLGIAGELGLEPGDLGLVRDAVEVGMHEASECVGRFGHVSSLRH